ncbi:MAG TPA: cyclic nucleotide-binding domain-containing protein [Nevskiaceae bacterium]|nr:cyclic nucleotide-binding domain-containing protein [Nevskiaceae bacterium]
MTTNFDRVSRDPGFRELFKLARHRDLPKNRVVIEEGSKPGHLYLIVSGLVAVRYASPRDPDLLLAYLYPGDFFGEMCLFPGVEARSAMIKTASDCALLEIGYEPFVELTRKYPSLWLELAGQLAHRLRTVNHRLAEMPALHAADRMWIVLKDMAANIDARGDTRTLRITRQDLGKLAGCSRELAGMILKDFAKAGRISVRGKTITVPASALTSS